MSTNPLNVALKSSELNVVSSFELGDLGLGHACFLGNLFLGQCEGFPQHPERESAGHFFRFLFDLSNTFFGTFPLLDVTPLVNFSHVISNGYPPK